MPNRILRDWTDSPKFESITPHAERLFVRLLMKADDFGRFHADPRLVKSACFPLEENLRGTDIACWLDELSTRRLILPYEVNSRGLLAIVNFRQRLKQSKPKFPPRDGEPDDWLPDDSRNFPELPGTSSLRARVVSDSDSDSDSRGMQGGNGSLVQAVEDIIAAYPRQSHLLPGRAVLLDKLRAGADAAAVLAGVKRIAGVVRSWKQGDRRFIPRPDKFFAEERWTDDAETWRRDAEPKEISLADKQRRKAERLLENL